MRALVTAAGGHVHLAEVPAPEPGPGEVVLRLRLCGLCGTDLYKLEHRTVPPGTVLGHEIVGDVEAVGAAVSLPIGTRCVAPHHVACGACDHCRRGAETSCDAFKVNQLEPGGFAERVLVRAHGVAGALQVVPEPLDDTAALFLEPTACVLRSLDRGLREQVASPEAFILGAGAMGLLHLLALRAERPDCKVTIVEPIAERRTTAAELGADAVLSPDAAMSSPAATGDAVFDTAGGSAALELGLRLLRPAGTLVLFAHDPEPAPARVALHAIFRHELRVVGAYSGSRVEQERAFELLVAGRLDPRPLLSLQLPFGEWGRAVRLVRAHRALKVALHPEPGP